MELAGSASLGVPYGQYKTAIRENELWKENIDCAAAPFDGLVNEQKVEVDAVVCLSGNVLVRIKPPGKNTAYKWVPLEESAGSEKRAAAFSFIGSAFAQVPPPPPGNGNFQVLCQQWVGNGFDPTADTRPYPRGLLRRSGQHLQWAGDQLRTGTLQLLIRFSNRH